MFIKRTTCMVIFVLLFALFLAGESKNKNGILQGTITGPDSKPLAGITVMVYHTAIRDRAKYPRMVTKPDGIYHFSVPPGRVWICVCSNQFISTSKSGINLKAGTTQTHNFSLKKGGMLVQGKVVNPGNQGVDLILFFQARGNYQAIYLLPTSNGGYSLRLPKTIYTLGIKKPGYISQIKQIYPDAVSITNNYVIHPLPQPASSKTIEWIKNNLIPLKTVKAESGLEDLQPLKKIIDNARVVSLGEATHGTREFFQLKHRILEFLVKEMGFTIFAIEANLPEAFAVNDYVLYGKGDPLKALKGLHFWTWNTQEVLGMIKWMRKYNLDPNTRKKIKFYGFDMQYAQVAITEVKDYLKRTSPELLKKNTFLLKEIASAQKNFGTPKEAKFKYLDDKINQFLKSIKEQQKQMIQKSTPAEYAKIHRFVQVLKQYFYLCADKNSRENIRDLSMAENVEWILNQEGPGTKVVLWAHNGHALTSKEYYGNKTMGWYLKQKLGGEQLVFGFSFNQGGFQAIGPKNGKNQLNTFMVNPNPLATMDYALGASGQSIFALDLKKVPERGNIGEWFSEYQGHRSIGAVYNPKYDDNYVAYHKMTEILNVLLFVEKTTAAIANKTLLDLKDMKGKLINLNFEKGKTNSLPVNWLLRDNFKKGGFAAVKSLDSPKEGKGCLKVFYDKNSGGAGGWATALQKLDARPYRGKKIRFSGWIKRTGKTMAVLWIRVDRKSMGDGLMRRLLGKAGPGSWEMVKTEEAIPADASLITIGCMIIGQDAGYFDDLKFELFQDNKKTK